MILSSKHMNDLLFLQKLNRVKLRLCLDLLGGGGDDTGFARSDLRVGSGDEQGLVAHRAPLEDPVAVDEPNGLRLHVDLPGHLARVNVFVKLAFDAE